MRGVFLRSWSLRTEPPLVPSSSEAGLPTLSQFKKKTKKKPASELHRAAEPSPGQLLPCLLSFSPLFSSILRCNWATQQELKRWIGNKYAFCCLPAPHRGILFFRISRTLVCKVLHKQPCPQQAFPTKIANCRNQSDRCRFQPIPDLQLGPLGKAQLGHCTRQQQILW